MPQRVLTCFVPVVFLALSLSALAQEGSAAAQREPTALGFVQIALTSLGGEARIGQVQSGAVQSSVEAMRPGWPSGSQTWKFSGTQYRHEFTSTSGTVLAVTDDSGGVRAVDGKNEAVRAHVTDARFVPAFAALELYRRYRNPSYSFVVVRTELVAGRTTVRIRTRLERDELSQVGTAQDWLLDSATGLPLRVEYRQVDNFNGLATSDSAVNFSDFRSVSGVLVPFRMESFLDGMPWNRITVQSVVFNSGTSPGDFVKPAGGVK